MEILFFAYESVRIRNPVGDSHQRKVNFFYLG